MRNKTKIKESTKQVKITKECPKENLSKVISADIIQILNEEQESQDAKQSQEANGEGTKNNDLDCRRVDAQYHHVRLVFPFKFYVEPQKFNNIYSNFSNIDGIIKQQNTVGARSNNVKNEEVFINLNARMHTEIVDIFDNTNKTPNTIMFGLFRFDLSMLDEESVNALNKMLLEKVPKGTAKEFLEIEFEEAHLYLFESGIGFFEWKYRFNWHTINVADDLIVKFCDGIRSRMNFEWLCDVTKKIFLRCSEGIYENEDEFCDFFDKKPFSYITIKLANSSKFYFGKSIRQATVTDGQPLYCGDKFLIYNNSKKATKYIFAESNSLIRVGSYRWEINDQAAWFCLIFVLHQKYALSSLSNELMKIDSAHSFSRSRFLRCRLRQEEINYTNFRRRYVFESISNKTDVETIYDYLRERFEINKLLNEYVDSITPLQNYARTSREKNRNKILFAFSVTTAINIIVGYLNHMIRFEELSKNDKVVNAIVFPLLLAVNIGVILWTCLSIKMAKNRLLFKNTNSCEKTFDKITRK
mgnify:CR=1 FL=1